MAETAQQYKQRILNNVAGKDALKVQAEAVRRLRQLVAVAPAPTLRRRPAPEKWSVAEILAHLADCEIVFGYRIRTVAGTPGASLQPFDQDVWAQRMNYRQRPALPSLAAFAAARTHNLALLKSLSREQRAQVGMHAERGPESIETLMGMMAGHDLNHLAQVEALLQGAKKPKSSKPKRRPAAQRRPTAKRR